MSSANARCSSGLTIALPPNFTTIVSPWNRFSQGRESMSTCALASRRRVDRVRRRRVAPVSFSFSFASVMRQLA